eukprot:131977-Chlamydomonas_euryale.AAC.1
MSVHQRPIIIRSLQEHRRLYAHACIAPPCVPRSASSPQQPPRYPRGDRCSFNLPHIPRAHIRVATFAQTDCRAQLKRAQKLTGRERSGALVGVSSSVNVAGTALEVTDASTGIGEHRGQETEGQGKKGNGETERRKEGEE